MQKEKKKKEEYMWFWTGVGFICIIVANGTYNWMMFATGIWFMLIGMTAK